MKKKRKLYSKIFLRKQFFILIGLIIVVASALFTERLAYSLSIEEKKKMEVWVEATRCLSITDKDDHLINELILKIIEGNTTIPVVVSDKNRKVLDSRNLKVPKSEKEKYFQKFISRSIDKKHEFTLPLLDDQLYVYYSDSNLLRKLYYFPYTQLLIILIFSFLAIYAFRSSKKTEENRIWVGLSKETAHQLGTPISSLLAWTELLKLKYPDENLTPEIEKDTNRLLVIANRFSKIGSIPDLKKMDLIAAVEDSIEYMRKRSSTKININIHSKNNNPIPVELNLPLFEWVIENVFKNAIDAMNGEGTIDVLISEKEKRAFVDIKDTGKGLEKSKFKSIFNPGYTTKERGWGLGLSLSKRIVENYHDGKIFVKESEKNKGTCFRISLKLADKT